MIEILKRNQVLTIETNYPGYLVIDFESYRKLIDKVYKMIYWLLLKIMSNDCYIE